MSEDVRSMVLTVAERMFEDRITPEILAAAEEGIWPAELWGFLEQNGFTRVEDEGLTYPDGLALLQTAGYYGVPVPLAEAILASHMLGRSGSVLPEGFVTLGLVVDGPVHIRETNGGVILSGRWREVPWGRAADALVLWVPEPGGESRTASVDGADAMDAGGRVAVLPREAVQVEPHRNVAGEPRDVVRVEGAVARVEVASPWMYREVLAHAALTRVMLASGALERILDMTVQYAGGRVQFGRAIAKFQAVQQQIAELAAEAALFRAIANRSLEAAERESGSSVTSGELVIKYALLAKIRLAQVAYVATTHAHQVHGAIGFTQEYALHHYTRRLWAWRHEYGNERVWEEMLVKAIQHRDVWEFVTDPRGW